MTKLLKKDESYSVAYTGTGEQEEILFDISQGYQTKGSLRIIGGVDDQFTLKAKIGDTYQDIVSSSEGKIEDLTIFGKSKGIKLDIANNVSGDIGLEIIL